MATAQSTDPIEGLFKAALLELSVDDLERLLPRSYEDHTPQRITYHLLGKLDPRRLNVPRVMHRRLRRFRGDDLGDLITLFRGALGSGPVRLALFSPATRVTIAPGVVVRAADECVQHLGDNATRALLAAAVYDGSAAASDALDLLRINERYAIGEADRVDPEQVVTDELDDEAFEDFDPWETPEYLVTGTESERDALLDGTLSGRAEAHDSQEAPTAAEATVVLARRIEAALSTDDGSAAADALAEIVDERLTALFGVAVDSLDAGKLPPHDTLDALEAAIRTLRLLRSSYPDTDGAIDAIRDDLTRREGPDWSAADAAALLRCSWASADEPFTDLALRLVDRARELLHERYGDAERPVQAHAAPVVTGDVDATVRPFVALTQAVDARERGDDAQLRSEGTALYIEGGEWAQLAGAAAMGMLRLPDARPDVAAHGDGEQPAGTDVPDPQTTSDTPAAQPAGDVDGHALHAAPGQPDELQTPPAQAEDAPAEHAPAEEPAAEVDPEDAPADQSAADEPAGSESDATAAQHDDSGSDGAAQPDRDDEPVSLVDPAAPVAPDDIDGTDQRREAEPAAASYDDDPALAAAYSAGLLDLLAWAGRARNDDQVELAGKLIAYGCALRSPNGQIAAAYYDHAVDFDDSVLLHRSVALLLWASALRVALLAPTLQYGQAIASSAIEILDNPCARQLTQHVAVAAYAGEALTPDRVDAARGHADAEAAVADAVADAQDTVAQLRHQRFSHVGTTRAWQAMLIDDDSEVAAVVAAVTGDKRDRAGDVAAAVRTLRGKNAVDDLARRFDRRPSGESPIYATGRDWLRRRILDVADLATRWLDALAGLRGDIAEDAPQLHSTIRYATDHHDQLLAWLDHETTPTNRAVAGAAAAAKRITRNTLALLGGEPLDADEPGPAEAAGVSLLRCPGVAIDNFEPVDPTAVTGAAITAATATSWRDAFERHAVAGNIDAARVCAIRAADPTLQQGLAGLFADAQRRYRRDYTETMMRYRKTRYMAALGSERAADLERRLAAADPERLGDEANLAAADFALRRIKTDLDTALGRHADELHAELTALTDPEQTAAEVVDIVKQAAPQIRAEIVEGHYANAQQMLHAVRRGELPQAPPQLRGRLEGLLKRLSSLPGGDDPLEPAVPDTDSPDAADAARRAVELWHQLRSWQRDQREHSSLVRSILALLGVTVDVTAITTPNDVRGSGSHLWREITPAAVTRSSAERHFDLQTTNGQRWRVLAVRNAPDVDRLGQLVSDDKSGSPIVVLYDGTLTLIQRRQLVAVMRDTAADRAVIVVDSAVIADLAANGELRDFEAVADRTLPFADVDPYAPDGRESLPEVLFYGRDAEMRALLDPYGSLFVYGGRQLGKSALLTQTGRAFMRRSEAHVAVRLDVRSHLGELERHGPMYLLHLITGALRGADVPVDIDPSDPVASLQRSLVDWLDGDPGGPARGVLVLLDECDDFLDLDYAQRGAFPAVSALKALMEQTGRRFKPLLAGLHQVQRFARATNQPFMHFGRAVQVGILDPSVAPQLLVEPLHRLGYRFEEPQLVWQVLQEACYQPGILQAIGRTLVGHLSRRVVTDDEPPPTKGSTRPSTPPGCAATAWRSGMKGSPVTPMSSPRCSRRWSA